MPDAATIATVAVALIAAASAYASQKAASRASTMNTQTTSRVDMEREAYERARAFDTETITRQDRELEELRAENLAQAAEVKALKIQINKDETEINELKGRVWRLENRQANGGN